MTVRVKMPGGGDERIEPDSVLVIRDATDIERHEAPQASTCIWGGGFRIFPAESLVELVNKFSMITLARLTSPGGMSMLINAKEVSDRDDSSAIVDHANTKSVLIFGPGPTAPRIRVREAKDDLIVVWNKLGLPTDPFD